MPLVSFLPPCNSFGDAIGAVRCSPSRTYPQKDSHVLGEEQQQAARFLLQHVLQGPTSSHHAALTTCSSTVAANMRGPPHGQRVALEASSSAPRTSNAGGSARLHTHRTVDPTSWQDPTRLRVRAAAVPSQPPALGSRPARQRPLGLLVFIDNDSARRTLHKASRDVSTFLLPLGSARCCKVGKKRRSRCASCSFTTRKKFTCFATATADVSRRDSAQTGATRI